MSNRNHNWVAIFDWDGVVIDSSRQHEMSWEVVAAHEKLPLPEGHFHRGFGKRNEEIIPALLGWAQDPEEVARLSLAKEDAYRDLVRRDGIESLPGVRPWLDLLRASGVSCAVGSSTPRENIDCVVGIIGLEGYFSAIVASQDVRRGKPDPEVFLAAADRLGATPERAIVFEDAPSGIEAARAAGMKIVAVAGTHPPDTFPEVDRVVHRLDELSIEAVDEIFRNGIG